MLETFSQHGWDLKLFLSTFLLIFLAELPDKTAVAILIMASQRHPVGVYAGVCVAYVVQNMVAILFGGVLSLLPGHIVHMGSGVLFLVFAATMWFQREEKEKAPHLASRADFFTTARTAFVVIFIAEWGDLTQLAAATLVAQTHRPWTIFWAATLALWIASGIIVVIGHHAKKIIHPRILQNIAAVAFAIIGILLLTGVLG